MRLTVGDTIYVQGGPERPTTPIGAQMIIGYREVACRWPTASPVRVGHDDLGSLSNLVDLLGAPV